MSTDSIFSGIPRDLQFICEICDHNLESPVSGVGWCKLHTDKYMKITKKQDCDDFEYLQDI